MSFRSIGRTAMPCSRMAMGDGGGSGGGVVWSRSARKDAAPNGGVGVGVEHAGLAGGLAVMDDLEGPVGRCRGIVAQHDGPADEEGVDLVETSVS